MRCRSSSSSCDGWEGRAGAPRVRERHVGAGSGRPREVLGHSPPCWRSRFQSRVPLASGSAAAAGARRGAAGIRPDSPLIRPTACWKSERVPMLAREVRASARPVCMHSNSALPPPPSKSRAQMDAGLFRAALLPALLSSALAASSVGPGGAAEVGSIFVASCVGSVVQKLALFPIDTLKVRARNARAPPCARPADTTPRRTPARPRRRRARNTTAEIVARSPRPAARLGAATPSPRRRARAGWAPRARASRISTAG